MVRLNYLDKQFATYQRVDVATSRLERLQVILSLLVIALATGLVSADENLELTGIKLELPLWAFLGGGAVAVGVISVMSAVQSSHITRVLERIYSSYDELGFSTPKQHYEQGGGLASTFVDIATSLGTWPEGSSRMAAIYSIGAVAVVLLLPCGAQIAAMLKLGADFAWSWHVWLPLGASVLLTVATWVWALLQSLE